MVRRKKIPSLNSLFRVKKFVFRLKQWETELKKKKRIEAGVVREIGGGLRKEGMLTESIAWKPRSVSYGDFVQTEIIRDFGHCCFRKRGIQNKRE